MQQLCDEYDPISKAASKTSIAVVIEIVSLLVSASGQAVVVFDNVLLTNQLPGFRQFPIDCCNPVSVCRAGKGRGATSVSLRKGLASGRLEASSSLG